MDLTFVKIVINYAAWYIFLFIAIMWLLVLIRYGEEFKRTNIKRSKKLPSVSILVPAHNEEQYIEMCLKSLLNINYPKHLFEIIVIDDASTDKTSEIVKKFKKVKLLRNKTNKGKAYSLNKAIKIAKGEIIACIDADSIVEKDILMKMVGYFEDKKVASVTPALKVFKPRNWLEKIQATEYLLNIFLRKSLDLIDSIHVTPGVFSLYRKSVLEEVGGFDENNLTEDMEIALKIQSAGYRITNCLDAVSYTICPSDFRSLLKQRIRWYRGALQNTVKYKHMLFKPTYGNLGVFFLPFNLISIIAVILLFSIIISDFLQEVWRFIWHFNLIDWNFTVFLKNLEINFESLIFELTSSQIVFTILGLTFASYLLLKSFSVTREKFSLNKIGYFSYLLIYPLIMMAFWFIAMFLEIFKVKSKW